MPRIKRKKGVIVLIGILALAIDQLSKILLSNILPLNKSIPVIKNFFHLTLIHNTGIAFGILKGSSKIILTVTIIGLGLIIYSFKKDFFNHRCTLSNESLFLIKMAIGLIIGGAIGNMIDRIRFGYVIDFLDFRIWPVFNLADSFITVGAIILFWNLFIPTRISRK